MRRGMLAGFLLLGTGAVAHPPGAEAQPTAVSAGAGGGAAVDTGPWARMGQGRQEARAQHPLYTQVAKELGLAPERGPGHWEGEAVGGGALAGTGQEGCAEALAAPERVWLLSGTLSFASGEVLSITLPGHGPVKLRADASTCAVQRGQEQSIESLSEGTEVRASYVLEEGLPTARVVHAEPQRALH